MNYANLSHLGLNVVMYQLLLLVSCKLLFPPTLVQYPEYGILFQDQYRITWHFSALVFVKEESVGNPDRTHCSACLPRAHTHQCSSRFELPHHWCTFLISFSRVPTSMRLQKLNAILFIPKSSACEFKMSNLNAKRNSCHGALHL